MTKVGKCYRPFDNRHPADEIRTKIQDRMDLVYHGRRSRIAHLKYFGHAKSMCGQFSRGFSWEGTGNQDERDLAKKLPLCNACVGAAYKQGYLG